MTIHFCKQCDAIQEEKPCDPESCIDIVEIDETSERDILSRYDDFLDEVYGEVQIGPYKYATSHALKLIDETAYRCGFNDWTDSEIQDNRLIEYKGEYYELP